MTHDLEKFFLGRGNTKRFGFLWRFVVHTDTTLSNCLVFTISITISLPQTNMYSIHNALIVQTLLGFTTFYESYFFGFCLKLMYSVSLSLRSTKRYFPKYHDFDKYENVSYSSFSVQHTRVYRAWGRITLPRTFE
jgi:hypothetical protein